MTFLQFSQVLAKLEKTPSRLEMTYQLADLFAKLDKSEIEYAFYLMQGKLVPKYESLEFQLSVKMILRSLAKLVADDRGESTGINLFGEVEESETNLQSVTKKYKQLGDIGLTAEQILAGQIPEENLTINEVHEALRQIALDGGEGSQERKVEALVTLLRKVNPTSAKFISRIILGKLRLGFSTMTMIDALSWAMTSSKDESKTLENAYQKKADLGKLGKVYLGIKNKEARLKNLANYSVQAGVPVIPALCQRLNSSEEIIEKMEEVFAEPKFDGLRVQIHFVRSGIKEVGVEKNSSVEKTQIKAFTRNLEDVTHMFPELETAAKTLKCDSCIFDSEAIGFDPKTGKLIEFQKTIQRKRKHGIGEKAKEVPIRFYIFDLLELNDKSLIDEKLRKRKELLENLFSKNRVFFKTDYFTTSDPIKLRKFHEEQLGEGLEGAVMKQVDSKYVSGRKGWNWVKIKEEEGQRGKLSDTLDLVVMGYYYGRGKRAQFGIGAILVGVLGKDDQIKTIAKIGTGLSDEQLYKMKKICETNKVATQPKNYQVHKNLIPDIWVAPKIVLEIAADEITKSPAHSAGVALRFPRLIKFREDKSPEQATTTKELSGISHLK